MRKILIAVLFASLVVGWSVGDQPAAVAAGPCEELQGASLAGGSLADSTPIVLVHGFTGSKAAWFAPIDQAIDDDNDLDNPSFVGRLLNIDEASVWLFDYEETSARWVTDPTIGSALADLLQCFSDNGAWPAIIAAHSMGGLAARQAMSELADSEIVSGLVTFATPHLGSVTAEIAAQVLSDNSSSAGFFGPVKAAVKSSIQLCGQTKTTNASYECGWLNALPPIESEAGFALVPGSRQLQKLLTIPDHVQVLGLAGQIEIVIQEGWGFFYSSSDPWPIGDLIVGADSATAMSDENQVFTCQLNIKKGYAISDDARQLFGINYDDGKERGISALFSNPCYHSNLTKTVEITNRALGFISNIVEHQELDFGTLTLELDGIATWKFGVSTYDEVVAWMSRRFGPPMRVDPFGEECYVDEEAACENTQVTWNNLRLTFDGLFGGRLMGYGVREGPIGTATPEGVRVGVTTLAELELAYPEGGFEGVCDQYAYYAPDVGNYVYGSNYLIYFDADSGLVDFIISGDFGDLC